MGNLNFLLVHEYLKLYICAELFIEETYASDNNDKTYNLGSSVSLFPFQVNLDVTVCLKTYDWVQYI